MIDFKLAVLVYKFLQDLISYAYRTIFQLITELRRLHLRSSDVYACTELRTQSQIGDRSFTAAGPRLYSNLLIEVRPRNISFEHYKWLYLRRFCSFRLRPIIICLLIPRLHDQANIKQMYSKSTCTMFALIAWCLLHLVNGVLIAPSISTRQTPTGIEPTVVDDDDDDKHSYSLIRSLGFFADSPQNTYTSVV